MAELREYSSAYYNRPAARELMERMQAETLLMQGPMGSMLMGELDAADIPPAFWNLAEPQTVRRLHRLYEAAGAQVLLTNTFQASAPALARDGIVPAMEAVNRAAVDNARSSWTHLVVGSVGPCGLDWFIEDSSEYRAARAAYREQAHALFAAGACAIMLETFCSIRDVQPALSGALDIADGMPVLVSFAIDDAGNLLGDGLTIEGAIVFAEKHGASAVGINCCSLDAADAVVSRMTRAALTPVMIRPNAGSPTVAEDGALVWNEDPNCFARSCLLWREAGARLLGACCGATPQTTAAMSDALL